MLRDYVRSFKKGVFDDKKLPPRWIAWRRILNEIRHGYTFIALNAKEYIDLIRDKLPHLDDTDLEFLYDKINENEFYKIRFAGPPLLNSLTCRELETGKNFSRSYNQYYLKSVGTRKLPCGLTFSDRSNSYAHKHWGEILEVKPFVVLRQQNFLFYEETLWVQWFRENYELYYGEDSNGNVELITYDTILFEEFGNKAEWNKSNAYCLYDDSVCGKDKFNTCKIYASNPYDSFLNDLFGRSSRGGRRITNQIVSFLCEYEKRIRFYTKVYLD